MPIVFLMPFLGTNKSLVLRQKRHQVFNVVAGEIAVFDANFNTKYFFGTSNIFFI